MPLAIPRDAVLTVEVSVVLNQDVKYAPLAIPRDVRLTVEVSVVLNQVAKMVQ